MRQTLSALGALLFAAGILFVGGGLQGSLVAVRANGEGFSLALIGAMMSVYSIGFVLGCQWTPRIVKNVGHIRAFTALASIASGVAMAYVLLVDAYAWLIMRTVSGFCFAGVAMIIESWINERTTNALRGRVLSLYRIVDLGGLTIGQLFLSLADPDTFVLFAVVSILVSFSLVPVALTTSAAPQPITSSRLDLRRAFEVSPLAVVGTFLVGLASSSFWAIGPVYVQNLGFETWLISAFMSAVILSGAVAQWPIGALSDRVGRRKLTVLTALVASGAGVFLAVFAPAGPAWLLGGAAMWGFCAMSLFSLFVAQANDHARPDEYVPLNAGLLLLYGLGAIAGPLLSATAMDWFGTRALFGYTAVVHAAIVAYGLWRMSRRDSLDPEQQDQYQPVVQTSPVIFELAPHPGADAGQEEPDSRTP